MNIFRFRANSSIESNLKKQIQLQLKDRRKHFPFYDRAWLTRVTEFPKDGDVISHMGFRLLHHEFSGKWTPGLKTAVKVGRKWTKRVKGLKDLVQS